MRNGHKLIVYHATPLEATFTALDATLRGLNNEEAELRLKEFGANRLPQPQRRNLVLRFLAHFHLGNWRDAGTYPFPF